MPRLAWNGLVLAAVFGVVCWQAGLFAAAASVVVAAAVSIAFNLRAR